MGSNKHNTEPEENTRKNFSKVSMFYLASFILARADTENNYKKRKDYKKKYHIREKPNLSTNADESIDTIEICVMHKKIK